MCGRSRCSLSPQQVIAAARVPEDRWKDQESYKPSHNVSPGYNTPVVKRDKQQALEVHTMKWGLVPSFTKKDTEKPDHFRMFNARCETVAEKAVFGRLLQRQRCVVLFDGFYEWKKEGSRKQPFYVNTGEGNVMRMAGLFDVWFGAEGESPMYTYTIMTTDASKRLEWLHDRMPVLLTSDEQVEAWLDSKPVPDKLLHSICTPYNGENLVWHPVNPSMSSMSYQSADASKDMKRPNIASFFAAGKGKTATAKQTPVRQPAAGKDHPQSNAPSPVKAEVKVDSDSNQKAQTDLDGAGQHQQPGDVKDKEARQAPDSKMQFPDADGNLDEVVLPSSAAAKQPPDRSILNPDDAGGKVGGKTADDAEASQQKRLASPPLTKRGKPEQALLSAGTLHKRPKTTAPAKGTIDSFFGRKT